MARHKQIDIVNAAELIKQHNSELFMRMAELLVAHYELRAANGVICLVRPSIWLLNGLCS